MNHVTAHLITSLLYLGASCLIFVFGSSYFTLFRTNKSWLFKGSLVAGSTWSLFPAGDELIIVTGYIAGLDQRRIQ